MWPEVILGIYNPENSCKSYSKKYDLKTNYSAKRKTIFIPYITALCTVPIMAPIMTFLVFVFHNGLCENLLILWLPKLLINFQFAVILYLQLFYIGPLVRFIFKNDSISKDDICELYKFYKKPNKVVNLISTTFI